MANNFSDNNNSSQIEDAELIDLGAIWGSIKRRWALLLACIVVAIAAAGGVWRMTPAEWKATAALQIGQLPVNPTALIESTAQAAERFNQRQLQDQALVSVGLPLDELKDDRTHLLRKTLKATPGKNTNFVDVSVAAFSQENAKAYLNAAIQALIKTHDARLAPLIKNLDDRITINSLQMTEAASEKTRLEANLKNASASPSGGKFEPSVIAINLISKQDDLIRSLTAEHAALIDLHTKTNTFPTVIVDAIYVPERPASPKLSIFLVVGLILGASLGVILAMFLDRNRPKTAN
ncbi:Wzz/FepE/Etk N-terminal domain-containing protein [Collimonas sp.]|jgi:capsular polysaccharide biosynthesis protein|uniref:Wzz/FepE/Etk N-terminal domain-containing protein n=1 Tax=Collimonas sp. TaxID=1963772 RepID=UPI002CEE87FC|nr:Wzz/FepE/Etk N-terminal domain-containing protein [Collimonas sp.]HWX02841.1 Wzz/FepE/Etk N-terminal domain-containing protein [Collimonas sp.]